MLPATIKQLVITNCKKIKVRIIQIISSYFLVVSSWKEPKAYFHIVHIVARFFILGNIIRIKEIIYTM